MKILLVADEELRELWDHWNHVGKSRTEGVELILSAGDIKPYYLEFLVTMLNVPCLYVRGNHDGYYDVQPPRGCIDIDGKICELTIPAGGDAAGLQESAGPGAQTKRNQDPGARTGRNQDPGARTIRIAGLGGSMRYREGPDMYSEKEMRKRIRALRRSMRLGRVILPDGRTSVRRDLAKSYRATRRNYTSSIRTQVPNQPAAPASSDTPASRPIDILLTHAPSLGHGDLDDLPHRGFACFNDLIESLRPLYHCYGHVHREYDPMKKRESEHPSDTHLINVGGMYILDI